MASPAVDLVLDNLLSIYTDTHNHVVQAVENVPDNRFAEQFGGCINHPAWTLSHLCCSDGFMLHLLDEAPPTGDRYNACGPGSIPVSTRETYMSKDVLIADLLKTRDLVINVVRAKHTVYFSRESPEYIKRFAPTIGRVVIYLLGAHGSYHLAQLNQWKRAAGLLKA